MENHRYTNKLINESSPYLLQHAHNPVNWMPWDDEALEKAREEDKLLLISIGYAACHWCHVMEHESFEDELVARTMNQHFVCIKVDREERPDVDHVYLTAVQLISHHAGWPLNVVALPNGYPIWGGTYFPKESWITILEKIVEYRKQYPANTSEYAGQLQQKLIQQSLLPISNPPSDVSIAKIREAVIHWSLLFDTEEGGTRGAPKFMMPANLLFLQRWAYQQNDPSTDKFVRTTLRKMAFGGIHDQLGGGFARYSTDAHWKVPHFEKMLYDNAQMLSLYSQAFLRFRDPLYLEVITGITLWLKREMLSPEGGFYASLDADSEGVEGKFYTWRTDELQQILGDNFELFSDYFQVNHHGRWENGCYILLRRQTDEAFATKHKLTLHQLKSLVNHWKEALLKIRNTRPRPSRDTKIITSWNALAIQGLTDAYKATQQPECLMMAEQNARFILKELHPSPGLLYHTYQQGSRRIEGFLEDYALFIQALISMFEITGNKDWLLQADQLTKTTIKEFKHEESVFFCFSKAGITKLAHRTIEVYDQVIPSSNSVMANNLLRLAHLLGITDYRQLAQSMLSRLTENMVSHPPAYANWFNLALSLANPLIEITITGPDALARCREMQSKYIPNALFCAGNDPNLPLLKDRTSKEKTRIFICRNNTCLPPTENINEALTFIRQL